MEKVYIILSSQEYDVANHQQLWKEMAGMVDAKVIIVNIPADGVVSVLCKKIERIKDANKPPLRISDNCYLIRPFLKIRAELLPMRWQKLMAKDFWKSIARVCPEISDCRVNVLLYNSFWVRVLKGSHPNMKMGYYLFDEVRFPSDENKINRKEYIQDEYACANCDVLFTMTKRLAESRKSLQKNVHVIGNGAVLSTAHWEGRKFKKSIAFIGIFRDWIDEELLTGIIERMQDVLFVFVGSIDNNMSNYFHQLLNSYDNTMFYGRVKKEKIGGVYRMFDGIIVPYKQNDFMKATRPIKIVESVFAGTPVVTIPMDGYNQSSFIRFATDIESFCHEIEYIMSNPIDKESNDYLDFIHENSWSKKAKYIIEQFEALS